MLIRWLPIVVASGLALHLAAQERPNLSGTWALDPARSQSLVQGGTPPSTLEIQHLANELRIEATGEAKREVTTFFFERTAPTSAEAGMKVGRWSWDGPRLVTERTGDVQGQTVSAKQVYSLERADNELVVETLVEVQHGYTLRGTKNYATARDVYTRVRP
jgi:hypothetical protein